MKTIELKKAEEKVLVPGAMRAIIVADNEDQTENVIVLRQDKYKFKLTTVELIRTVISLPAESQKGGVTVAHMKKSLRVEALLDAVKEDQTTLELEDADFEFIGSQVKAMDGGWAFVCQFILDFVDQFEKKAE